MLCSAWSASARCVFIRISQIWTPLMSDGTGSKGDSGQGWTRGIWENTLISKDLMSKYIMFTRLLQTTNDPVFTIIRLVLGLVFFAHGAQKMLGWFGGYGFSGTMSAFSTSGMPTPLALLVILTEFFASVALIGGAFARVASGAIALLMVGVIVMVHAHLAFT